MNKQYVGHPLQVYGVEEHRLIGGKGDGMRLFQVKNGAGLEFTVSADRCADISRLSFKGDNFGYFSTCGYVGPQYYDNKDIGFLKSFTAGFLTTCGLTAVGNPCHDAGEDIPLHGDVANIPAEQIYATVTQKEIQIQAKIRAAALFSSKLTLDRTICCPIEKNYITIADTIENLGDKQVPLMFLYHTNIGYPLLSENSQLFIPSNQVVPRNDHAAKAIDSWHKMLVPQAGFEEQCYYHSFEKEGLAAIFNPDIGKGVSLHFDAQKLDYFIEWKMMGIQDYVLGLEPGNCHADGRNKMREQNRLKFIGPGETVQYSLTIRIIENQTQWKSVSKR